MVNLNGSSLERVKKIGGGWYLVFGVVYYSNALYWTSSLNYNRISRLSLNTNDSVDFYDTKVPLFGIFHYNSNRTGGGTEKS